MVLGMGLVHAAPSSSVERGVAAASGSANDGGNPLSIAQNRRGKKRQSRHGWVRIYTNSKAMVTIDGQPYPRRSENGMKIKAYERHVVLVKVGEKEKSYVVVVRPRETRTLMVDLTGYQTPPTPAAPSISKPTTSSALLDKNKKEEGDSGKLTVYSKPKGEVYVDGGALGATTPMINRELGPGRHEVQVKWENGQMSEVKTIRIRKGSKLKLFFRDRNNKIK